MDENPATTRQPLEAQLIDRALQDEAFRQELVRDPKGVFARELGIAIPEHIQVQVLEESPTTVYLVLPQPVPEAGAELSDEELAAVAGGWSLDSTECATCGGASCGSTCSGSTCSSVAQECN